LGNDLLSDLVSHSGNIRDLFLALELLGCPDWLLGQEGEVPSCFGDTVAATEGTPSGTAAGAGADADAGAGVLEGDLA
jgi:hypothetical protein